MGDQEVILHNTDVYTDRQWVTRKLFYTIQWFILTGNGWPGSYSTQYNDLYWQVMGDQEVILHNTVFYTDR
jgi:hypothetical protein